MRLTSSWLPSWHGIYDASKPRRQCLELDVFGCELELLNLQTQQPPARGIPHGAPALTAAPNCCSSRLIQIGKEAFLDCVVLQEVVIPTELSDIGNRAFCGCEQLQRFTLLDWGDVEQWVQAEHNAFFMCDKFEKPHWLELLPAEGPDSDAFDEESATNIANIMPVHGRLYGATLP